MNLTLTKRRKWIVAGVVILGTATPSFALFGFGDIVFDPSSYGQLVSQLSTLAKMLTTAQSQYNTIKSNVQNFSVKTVWQTELNKIKAVSVPNSYGETNGFTNALNLNNQSAALMAWTNSKIGLTPETSGILSTQTVGNSSNLTQLAMIEASDTASPDCLNAVGSYRQARLQFAQLDGSTSTNSEVEQLNLLNAAQAQQLNEQQAQGVLHACLAQQMTIQNMQQRNAAAQDLNTWGFVQAQHTANPTLNVADSGTWTTYLP
jgi:hypothetical protein